MSVLLISVLAAASGPNIVLVLADDMGQGDVGAFNARSRIPTPHMDAVAAQGMICTDAHSASAVCTPSRYALLTGEYAWRTELKRWVLGGGSPALINPETPTLGGILQDAGWTTLGVGKWHLGVGQRDLVDWSVPYDHGPCDMGFDHWQGIPASLDMAPYVWMIDDRLENQPTEHIEASAHRRQNGSGFWRAGGIAPDLQIADILPRTIETACDWIDEHAGKDEPFFLYVPLSAPHTPWLPTAEARGTTEVGWYGDFMVDVDRGVGRINAALQRAGMADHTIFIITSDNGGHWPDADIDTYRHESNNGFRGQKADIHEGGHRVPFIMRWPGHVDAGSSSDVPFCLVDLMPTLAAAVGVQLPEGASPDGRIVHFDQPADEDRVIVHHSGNGMFAVRQGRWKLIEGHGSGGFTRPARRKPAAGEVDVALFDLYADPGETNDIARGNPGVVARLRDALQAVRGDD